jgi:tetratricopeptide (TPR) repeat protein
MPRGVLLSVIALVLVALAWQPALRAPYQYDDYVTPLKDPASQSISAWWNALPETLRPLTKLSFALESSLGASSAPARRGLNAALFTGCVAALALLAQPAGLTLSLALATLWAVHPVHAETIIALAGRSVLLSLLCMLASALALSRGRSSWAIALALAAVLARETALPWLVACAFLVDRRLALASSLLGSALVLSSARMRALLLFSWSDPSAWNRLGLQWAALPKGTLMLLVEPSAFTVDIEFNPLGLQRAFLLLLALTMYALAVWLAWRGDGLLRLAALLWLSAVVPLHSVVPKLDPLTARSFSASSAALALLLACALARTPTYRVVLPACAAAIAFLVFLTRERAALYLDPIALWRDAAVHSQQTTRPLVNLGTLLAQNGQLQEARAALEQALRRNPNGTDIRERLSAVNVLIETRRLMTEPTLDETTR